MELVVLDKLERLVALVELALVEQVVLVKQVELVG